MADLLILTPEGLYCPAGGFHVDPWGCVDRALITHAHSDHDRRGHRASLASNSSLPLLRERLGTDTPLEGLAFGEPRRFGDVTLSLHPAGHMLGSAQVRIEYRGEVWVVSGDYKLEPDPTCEPFEPQRCDCFVTESTFGLPIYRWPDPADVFAQINDWWRGNQEAGRTSLLFGYAVGKGQRLLSGLDPAIGPILLHGAVSRFTEVYRAAGIALPPTLPADAENARRHKGRALVVAPPSAAASPWARKFAPASTAFASGWMAIRGTRRRRALDRGFVLSDHADWEGLLRAIRATGAGRVWATHGQSRALVRYLNENGWQAATVETKFGAPEAEAAEDADDACEGEPAAP